jgi:predicted transposase YdaD
MTTAEKLRQEGRQEGSYKMMISLVRNAGEKGLSEEVIAQIVNLDVALVRKILNNEPVDIPLHLLPDS